MTRNRNVPTKLRGGGVVQAGLNVRRKDERNDYHTWFGKYRGIVLNTYVSDEGNRTPHRVVCDVILVRSMAFYPNVPVQQPVHGVNNAQLWIPRPTTRDIGGAPLNARLAPNSPGGSSPQPVNDLAELDGDQVVVEFLEGRVAWPIITGALSHPRSNRTIVAGPGWAEGDPSSRGAPQKDELYQHHQGTEVRINASGDLLIDTVGAYEDGATEDPSSGQGQIRLRVKEDQRFTVEIDGVDVFEVWKDGSQVVVDMGEGADERVILGDSFRQFFNDFLTNEYATHTHPTGVGPSGAPTQPATQMGEDVLSDLARVKKS